MTDQQGQTNGHDLGSLGEIILQRTAPNNPGRTVTLSEMFNLLSRGGTKYIRREHPEIKPEAIALGRAWLIAGRPDLYDREIAKNQSGDLRMLVDENLSARIIPIIRNGFGYATHTNFAKDIHAVNLQGCGNSGTGDLPVWEWALKNNIDAIVTLDRAESKPGLDLTRIAKDHAVSVMKQMVEQEGREIVDMADLPVIIHVTCKLKNYKYVSGVINNNRDAIHQYIQTRTSPVITVDEHGVRPDKTYLDLWKKYLRDLDIATNGHPRIPRRERRVEQWWNEIAKRKLSITPERRDEIDNMLRQAAEIYKPGDGKPDIPELA